MGFDPTEIYLDNAATTEPWPEVRSAVEHAMKDGFGNPSSLHARGARAARAVAEAAEHVRVMVGGDWRVVFTSGGTEADNTAVLGFAPKGRRKVIVTSAVEHSAVTDACLEAQARGSEVIEISAGETGVVSPDEISRAVDDRAALVALVYVASEMGTVQPVGEIARMVKRVAPKCRVHVDAVQAAPQLPRLDLPAEVDSVAVSAHKIHGPQGVGALLLRPGIRPRSLLFGGDQQDGLRPGTLNLPGITGFGEAARLMNERRTEGALRMRAVADGLLGGITGSCDGVRPLGDPASRAAGMLVLAVDGVRSEVLLHNLEQHGVYASAGSACHARRTAPPACLVDAGLRPGEGSVRLSLSFDTDEEAASRAVSSFIEALELARSAGVS